MDTNAVRPWRDGNLTVAPDGRTLCSAGKPFFWLGDTAWLLFKQLDLAESRAYLENRQRKGYNVIQAMLLHKLPLSNHCGRPPFFENDFTRPDTEGAHSYWSHVDQVLDIAEELGLYMALVPAWGENVDRGYLTADNVGPYTEFVAERYAGRPNLIWMVGGDTVGGANIELWDTMGAILRKRCPGHLITFHPFGATSSTAWFHDRDWLDFNMFQSGHSTYAQVAERRDEFLAAGRKLYAEDNWRYVLEDLSLSPTKPTVDAEPCYERVLKGLHGPGHDLWMAPDIRRFAYWSVFAGAMGFTYGHSAIMQFFKGGPVAAYKVTEDWREALHHPAANQMIHLRRLMEDVGFAEGRPAQQLLACAEGSLADRIMVFAGNTWLLAYTATGREIELAPPFAAVHDTEASWFDPVSGVYSTIGRYPPGKLPAFAPPRRFDGSEDWVLVLRAV